MKRIAVFVGMLLTLPAFAEVAPVFYDDGVEYSDVEYDDGDIVFEEEETATEPVKAPVVPVGKPVGVRSSSASRVTASRAVPAATTPAGRRDTSAAAGRVVAARTTTNSSPRGTVARTVTNRAATTTAATRGTTNSTRAAATRATGGKTVTRGATTTRSASSNGALTSRAARGVATTQQKITYVGSTGGTLYNPNGVTSDASYSADGVRVGVRRNAAIRSGSIATGTTVDTSAVVDNSADMDALAELTDYCKAQYANCMDNYCNVLDDNQGRCSCSANLKNYAKAEETLKQVTAELQDVATKISYIGLSANEISTLFSQTVGELEMQSKTDNSQLKANLDKIQGMIVSVQSGKSSSSSNNDMTFDLSGLLDFSFDSTGFDISALLGGTSSNTSSINNQRGEKLYKTAAARCKANVLNSCVAQGVDAAIITNSYDLEIDKQCIAYERSLNDSNEQMDATVRNAKNVLQKARLLVAQQKNEYDMRGCVTELDNCMQDEFVCGTDYENCLDPTGRYIVNGEIVVGSQPGAAIDNSNEVHMATATVGNIAAPTSSVFDVALYRTWDYDSNKNAWALPYYNSTISSDNGAQGNLSEYISKTVTSSLPTGTSENMSAFLQNKIGYNDKNVNYGMCMAVLNKCQNYTYTGTGTNITYKPNNDVIKQYLARVLVKIKAKQDEILNDYAASCITDVNSCLSQNNYPTNSTTSVLSGNAQANIAINACRANIITCMSVNGYSIQDPTPSQLANWVCGIIGGTNCATGNNTNGSTSNISGNQYILQYDCGIGSGTPPTPMYIAQGATFTPKSSTCTPPTDSDILCSYSFLKWKVSDTEEEYLTTNSSTDYSWNENKTLIAQYRRMCVNNPVVVCLPQTGFCVSSTGEVGSVCYSPDIQNTDTCVCGNGSSARASCPNQAACTAAGGTWNNNSCQ